MEMLNEGAPHDDDHPVIPTYIGSVDPGEDSRRLAGLLDAAAAIESALAD